MSGYTPDQPQMSTPPSEPRPPTPPIQPSYAPPPPPPPYYQPQPYPTYPYGQPFAPPQPAPQPSKQSYSGWILAAIACGVLALIAITFIASATLTTAFRGGVYSPPVQSTATAMPTPTSTPTTAPKVVLTMSGTGTEETNNFSVSGATQKLVWTCDPKSFAFPGYNVMAELYTTDNQIQDFILNTLCGRASGQSVGQTSTLHIPTGTYYLKISSEGAWTVSITDFDHG